MHGILFNVTERIYQYRSAGIYRIAHFLREHGADVEVIDWANHWQLNELKELFKSRYSHKTKFIGFSHMFSMWAPVLEEFCAWVKATYPEIKIISGSSGAPWFYSRYIDFYVKGFGEYAVLELTKYICGNAPRPRFSLTLANGKPLIDANVSYTAYPMKSLMIKYENRDFIQSHEWLGIETSRGCKFECAFCNFPVLGVKGDYTRDATDFELHLRDAYDRFGVTQYAIADETFNDRTEKITKYADVVESLPFKTWFSGYIRADLVHSRTMDLPELSRMNFVGQFYGIESFNAASAKSVGKGLSPEKVKKTLLDIKNYFKKTGQPYRGSVSLIVGLPHETIDSLEHSMKWLIENWQEQSFIAFVMTIPRDEHSNKQSLIGKNYTKYGYRELSDTEIKSYSNLDSTAFTRTSRKGSELLWSTQHMNIFQAGDILEKFISLRNVYDFRHSNYNVISRSNIKSIEDRFGSSYHDFVKSLVSDIDWYVQAKLKN